MTDTQRQIREAYPGLAAKADKGQRLASIKLFCIECMGGDGRAARDCAQTECFLHGCRGSWSRENRDALSATALPTSASKVGAP